MNFRIFDIKDMTYSKAGIMKILKISTAEHMGGSIPIPGAKNSALALLAGACLTCEPVAISNVPSLADVENSQLEKPVIYR